MAIWEIRGINSLGANLGPGSSLMPSTSHINYFQRAAISSDLVHGAPFGSDFSFDPSQSRPAWSILRFQDPMAVSSGGLYGGDSLNVYVDGALFPSFKL